MRHQTTEQGVRPFVWVTAAAAIGLTLVIGLAAKLTTDSPSSSGEGSAQEEVDASSQLPDRPERSRSVSLPAASRNESERSSGESLSSDPRPLSVEPLAEPDHPQLARSSEGDRASDIAPLPNVRTSAASAEAESLASIATDLRNFTRITSPDAGDRPVQSPLRPSATGRTYRVSLEDYLALTAEELRIDTLKLQVEQDYAALQKEEQRLFAELETARQQAGAELAKLKIEADQAKRNHEELKATVDELYAKMSRARAQVREDDPASVDRYNQLVDPANSALMQLDILEHELQRTLELEIQAAEYAVNGIERDFMTRAAPFNLRVDEQDARIQEYRALVNAYNAKLVRVGTLVR